jgi:hypothetical protein
MDALLVLCTAAQRLGAPIDSAGRASAVVRMLRLLVDELLREKDGFTPDESQFQSDMQFVGHVTSLWADELASSRTRLDERFPVRLFFGHRMTLSSPPISWIARRLRPVTLPACNFCSTPCYHQPRQRMAESPSPCCGLERPRRKGNKCSLCWMSRDRRNGLVCLWWAASRRNDTAQFLGDL